MAIGNYVTESGGPAPSQSKGRITYSGIFNDPNDMGLLFVVCIACVLYLPETTTSSKIARLALIAALGWLLYGVYLTNSRGTMLGAIAVIGFNVWRRYGYSALIGGAAVAVPVLIARLDWPRSMQMRLRPRVASMPGTRGSSSCCSTHFLAWVSRIFQITTTSPPIIPSFLRWRSSA